MLKVFFDNSGMFIAQDLDGADIWLPGTYTPSDPDTDGNGILPLPG